MKREQMDWSRVFGISFGASINERVGSALLIFDAASLNNQLQGFDDESSASTNSHCRSIMSRTASGKDAIGKSACGRRASFHWSEKRIFSGFSNVRIACNQIAFPALFSPATATPSGVRDSCCSHRTEPLEGDGRTDGVWQTARPRASRTGSAVRNERDAN